MHKRNYGNVSDLYNSDENLIYTMFRYHTGFVITHKVELQTKMLEEKDQQRN